MHSDSTSACIVLVTDQQYWPRAQVTIEDIRTIGRWVGDLVIVAIDFIPPVNYVNVYGLTILNRPHLDISSLLIAWKDFPLKPMDDQRHTKKLAQWNKFYVFDEYFWIQSKDRNWSKIIYLDCGMRVLDSLKCLIDLDCNGCLMAPDDSLPNDNGNRFKCQLDWDANQQASDLIRHDFPDLSDFGQRSKYFLNCMWIYDPKIIESSKAILSTSVFDTLVEYMSKYPISKCNEMGIMNLLFTFKLRIWTPLPETYDYGQGQGQGQCHLFGWSENNYGDWRSFCLLKYPTTIPLSSCPKYLHTIGVAVPCYNKHIKYLPALLQSINKNTIKPIKVVVSCSSVTTEIDLVVLKEICAQVYDFKLLILATGESKNAAENRNIATKYIDTDIVSYFDADDIMHPQRLELIQTAFTQYPKTHIVLHDYIDCHSDAGKNADFSIVHSDGSAEDQKHFILNQMSRAPSGCAIVNYNNPLTMKSYDIHHSQSSVSRYLTINCKYGEGSEYAYREDALFCGDILAKTNNSVYISHKLSKYFNSVYFSN